MSHECNSDGTSIMEVSESVDIATKHVEKIDDYGSKFKAICLMYNLNRDRYDFIDEVFFLAPTPKSVEDGDICSEITLPMSIMKVYRVHFPGQYYPDIDTFVKIIIKRQCEYTINSKKVQKPQYEIPFVLE